MDIIKRDGTLQKFNAKKVYNALSKAFAEKTGVCALAVAVGTAHGKYKQAPKLAIERIKEIKESAKIPLVLHGGSGTPDDQMQNAIHHGITKINIYSDVVGALNKGLKNKLNSVENPSTWPFIVYEDAMAMMKEVVKDKIRKFGSASRI